MPTDFSEHSKFALENAAFIAQKTRAELVVLHIAKNEKKVDKEKIDNNFKDIKKLQYLKFVKIDFVIEYGTSISKLINKAAQDKQVDLIVMGSNGANNTEEIILGSTTENVIRKTDISVLTVKREIITFELNHVLFPSDFSKEAYSIFDEIKAFAKIFGAKIHLLRVNKKDSLAGKTTPKMDAFIEHFKLDEEGIQYEKSISTNPSAEFGILNYSVENQIDVIAIGTHGKGLLKKIIQISTSQSLVRDAFKPVLTVRFK